MQPRTKIFAHLVRDYMRSDPVVVSPETSVSDLIERLSAGHRTSALVVDPEGRLAGIITEQDVTRRIVLRCAGDEPVSGFMSAPVKAIAAGDYLYHAIARMRAFGWRHMPVVDRDGRPVGLIDLHAALAVAAEATLREIESISQDDSREGLRQIKAAQVELAESLFADRVPAPEIQAVITRINRDIHCRVIDRALAEMAEEGMGPPPVRFELLIMGSGGRGENYLYPDQDNGFILDDYPDEEHGRIDPFFIALAERMTESLDAIGFPYCLGYVMATNPIWRKTRSQWRMQIDIWGQRGSAIAAQLGDIFFDFRGAYRETGFADELRTIVTETAKNSPHFLRALYEESERTSVALGWFGRLVGDRDKGGKINLKHRGTLPLVTGLRMLSLKHGVSETSTLRRIETLCKLDVLNRNQADYLNGAFLHITGLLLRQQLADFTAGEPVGNYVHPDRLSRRERDMLVDGFKAIEDLSLKAKEALTGRVF